MGDVQDLPQIYPLLNIQLVSTQDFSPMPSECGHGKPSVLVLLILLYSNYCLWDVLPWLHRGGAFVWGLFEFGLFCSLRLGL